jgi:hypothetical protein
MRAIAIAVFIAMLACEAAAQNASPPATGTPPTADRRLTNGMGSIWQAPVGHRQPTLRDLPLRVRRDERSVSNGQGVLNPLGAAPSICSGC